MGKELATIISLPRVMAMWLSAMAGLSFTHPRRIEADRDKDTFEQRRSSIQVVELEFSNGWLVANRNKPTYVQIMPAE